MRLDAFGATALVGLLLVSVGASEANATPKVALKLPSQATVGEATSFQFNASGLPSSVRLVLQRRQGTARVWKTVVSLGHLRKGTSEIPSLSLGVYSMRLAALGRRGQVVAQHVGTLPVFGEVPFSRLLEGAHIGGGVSISAGTYTTATSTFEYFIIYDYDGNLTNEPNQFAFSVSHNPCRSIHLEFVGRREEGRNPTLTAELVQATADPIFSAPSPIDNVGALEGAVAVGKSWGMRFEGAPFEPASVFMNGAASCDSTHITE